MIKKIICLCFALLLGLGAAVSAQAADEVVIGVMNAFSGAYAAMGEDSKRGAGYAIEEAGGKVLGKPLRMEMIDTELKPGVAARKLREAVDSKGIKFFNGCASSGVALAVGQAANEKKALFYTSVGADEVTGTKCNRYTFRWSLPTYGAVEQTVRPLLKKFPEAKRWYTITPDYVFGHSLLNNAKNVMKEFGAEHVGNDMHPIGHSEFSSFITKAMAAKADFVVFFNFGKDTINALKQANNFGLKNKAKILVAWSAGLRDMEEIGPEACGGVYFGCQYWHDIDAPVAKKLGQVWMEKYKRFPSYSEVCMYLHTTMQIKAIEKAGSTDVDKVVKVLEGMKYDGPTGPEEVQAFDHQTKKRYFLLLAKEKKDIKGPGDNATLISSGISVIPQSKTECKMN